VSEKNTSVSSKYKGGAKEKKEGGHTKPKRAIKKTPATNEKTGGDEIRSGLVEIFPFRGKRENHSERKEKVNGKHCRIANVKKAGTHTLHLDPAPAEEEIKHLRC